MSHSNHPHPPRQTRQTPTSTTTSRTVRTIATTAAMVYGAYKAYEYFNRTDEEDEEQLHQVPPSVRDSSSKAWKGLSQWMSSLLVEDDENRPRTNPQSQRQPQFPPKKVLDARSLQRRTQQSLRKCREEILKAYGTCWPSLQMVIDKSTDTTHQTQQLRLVRKDAALAVATDATGAGIADSKLRQQDLWRDIQLETLTRLISTEYASSLLLLSLTMQLHWIGGQVFQRKHYGTYSSSRRHGGGSRATHAIPADPARWAQHIMMESHQYMEQQGIPLLITAVRRAISSSSIIMQEWTAATYVSKSDVEQLLMQIDQHLERGTGGSSHSRNWIRLVLPDPALMVDESDEDQQSDEDHDEDDDNDDHHRFNRSTGDKVAMVEALWDLAESPAWADAQVQTLQIVKQYVRDQGWGKIYGNNNQENDQEVPPTAIPVAKLMAPFKSACGLVAAPHPPPASTNNDGLPSKRSKNSWPLKVQKLVTVLELGEISFQAEM